MHHCIGFTKQNHNFSKFLLGCTPLWLGSTGLVDLQTKKPQVHILAFLPSPSESSLTAYLFPVRVSLLFWYMKLWIPVSPAEFSRSETEQVSGELTHVNKSVRTDLKHLGGWHWLSHAHTSQHTDQTTSGYPIILLLIYHPCFPSLLFSLGGYGLFRRLFSLTVRQLKANICSVLWGDS